MMRRLTVALILALLCSASGYHARAQQARVTKAAKGDEELARLATATTIRGVDYDFTTAFQKAEPDDWYFTTFLLFPEYITNIEERPGPDTAYYNTWATVGTILDARSSAFTLVESDGSFTPNIRQLWDDESYRLDSMAIFYTYNRKVDEQYDTATKSMQVVNDQLEISLFKSSGMLGTFNTDPEYPWATVKHDRITRTDGNRQLPPEARIRVPLRNKDTVSYGTSGYSRKVIDLGLYDFRGTMDRHSGLLGATVNYLPGQATISTDTLRVSKGLKEPYKRINEFSYVVLRDGLNYKDRPSGEPYRQPSTFNNGLVLPVIERYEEDHYKDTVIGHIILSTFIPGWAYDEPIYPKFVFYLTVEKSIFTSQEREDSSFILNQPYPNPASIADEISFPLQLSQASTASLSLLSADGRIVQRLPAQRLSAGQQKLQLSVQGLKPGLYLYRLQVGDEQQSGRLQLK